MSETAFQVGTDHDRNARAIDPILAQAIGDAHEAAYRWTIADDQLLWSENAALVLQRDMSLLASGRLYSSLADPDNLTSRFDAVMHSTMAPDPDGVPFRIEYQLKATETAPAIWVEDAGRWYPDAEGRPAVAFGMVHLITERHRLDQELSFLSRNDALTGMMNRARMTEVLEEAIDGAATEGTPCVFAVAAINNLAVVNEAYGFEVADEVIAAVAQRLRQVMRNGDGIARYSGGKFGIILNACSEAELARALDRFLLVVRDSVIETQHGPVWALLSIGAVAVPANADNAVLAMARAEEALNCAMRRPSDSHVIYAPSEERNTQRMLNSRCATEIIDCLRNGVFHLAYQPLFDAATGEAHVHEALLRMKDTAGEYVAAGHLVPVAERLGLIRLIDRAVVQLALETLHRYPDARLSINISATTANDPRWNAQLIDMIESAQPLNERLTVEITETAALADLSAALDFFVKLRAAGCCVAIDDFGAGFTSFRNLRDLPVDVIKLDGSYCCNLSNNSENAYFAKTLIDMAHRLGIKTVAEWVETAEDAEALIGLGIDYLQGNHLGAPSVVPPWTAADSSTFAFGHDPTASVALHSVDMTSLDTQNEVVRVERTDVSAAPTNDTAQPEGIVFTAREAETPQCLPEPLPSDGAAEPADSAVAEIPVETSFAIGVVDADAQDLAQEPPLDEDTVADGDGDLAFEETEASLFKLRSVLDELSRHFQPIAAVDAEDQRLAG